MKQAENKTYEVLARKWRPRQFEEVVGQEHVTQTLQNAIKLSRVAHAYLFVGPRGTGKTSIARIFAKALNCAKGPAEKPCDNCPSCKGITDGNNLDVREIDAASNRQIDDIRSLREDVKYMPNGRYKIYIIDEVHMLTMEAFNALLKTLEEPPEQVIFIFATTEPQKVPLTILSRCQRFDLRRIPLRMIVECLTHIAKTEGVEIEPDALLAVARAAEGGLRDAECALDQLIAFQGKKIREADVLSVFGLIPRQALDELATALFKGEIAVLVRLVEQMDKQGKDMHRLLLELLEHCRNLLIYLEVAALNDALDLTENQIATLKSQAPLIDSERLLRIIAILTEGIDRLRFALSKKTLLEVTLIRCARAATVVSLDQIIAELRQMAAGAAGPEDRGQKSSPSATQALPETSPRQEATGDRKVSGQRSAVSEQRPEVRKAEQPAERPVASEAYAEPASPKTEDELSLLLQKWHSIVDRVGKAAALAKANLLDAFPVEVAADKVKIAFEPEFAERIEQANAGRNRLALQNALGDLLQRPVSVEFVIKKKENNYGPNAAAPFADPALAPVADHKTNPQHKHKWLSNEAVRKTLDLFEGRIVEIRE